MIAINFTRCWERENCCRSIQRKRIARWQRGKWVDCNWITSVPIINPWIKSLVRDCTTVILRFNLTIFRWSNDLSFLQKLIDQAYRPMLVDLSTLDKIGSFPGLWERAKENFYTSQYQLSLLSCRKILGSWECFINKCIRERPPPWNLAMIALFFCVSVYTIPSYTCVTSHSIRFSSERSVSNWQIFTWPSKITMKRRTRREENFIDQRSVRQRRLEKSLKTNSKPTHGREEWRWSSICRHSTLHFVTICSINRFIPSKLDVPLLVSWRGRGVPEMTHLQHGIPSQGIRWLFFDCSVVDRFVHQLFNRIPLFPSEERITLTRSTTSRGMTKKRISLIRFDVTIGMARSIFTSVRWGCLKWIVLTKNHWLFGFFSPIDNRVNLSLVEEESNRSHCFAIEWCLVDPVGSIVLLRLLVTMKTNITFQVERSQPTNRLIVVL